MQFGTHVLAYWVMQSPGIRRLTHTHTQWRPLHSRKEVVGQNNAHATRAHTHTRGQQS